LAASASAARAEAKVVNMFSVALLKCSAASSHGCGLSSSITKPVSILIYVAKNSEHFTVCRVGVGRHYASG
jgi:hypothetical protein